MGKVIFLLFVMAFMFGSAVDSYYSINYGWMTFGIITGTGLLVLWLKTFIELTNEDN